MTRMPDASLPLPSSLLFAPRLTKIRLALHGQRRTIPPYRGSVPPLSFFQPPRAWAEIDLGAIRHNLNVVKQAAKGEYYMPVVKAAAYGHGLEQVCRTLDSEGIAFFGVANVGEARRISQAGCRTRPYILGPAFPEEREEIVLNGWRSFISTIEEAVHYNSLARLYGKGPRRIPAGPA